MLYIVSTPIGNLDDLSIRQAQTILNSDVVLAEDTRSAKVLIDACQKLFPQITVNHRQSAISYYREIEFQKLPQVIEFLRAGKNIALISESGMPLMSDPGFLLVQTAVKQRLPFTVIPGPSAVTASLVASGFHANRFVFMGFLPKKRSELLRSIDISKRLKAVDSSLVFVFYESAKRVPNSLKIMNDLLPDSSVAICREMTKKFEEVIRGKPGALMNHTYKGEITVVMSF